MKKTLKNLVEKLGDKASGELEGGFGSLRGGMSPLLLNTNKTTCTNSGTCKGTNQTTCTNSGTCTGTNTIPTSCSNTGTCSTPA
jgi:hypothetical protein